MRRLIISALVAALGTGLAAGRPFTNTGGKTIEAEVEGATATTVTLKLKNGKTARVKLDTLSEADQNYVQKWIETKVPRLRVTPKLIRSNRDDERGEFYWDEDRQMQLLSMTIDVQNEDSRIGLGESELKYILVGRSVAKRNQYKILAVQKATFKLGVQDNITLTFKQVKNVYDDGDYDKSGHRCIGYVLHTRRKSDDREVYSFASTPVLEKGLFNIITLKSGDITDENFLKPGKPDANGEGGGGIIVVE